jgi:hypothetical protein
MSNKRYYLFLEQDGYFKEIKNKNDLPFSDNSYFVSGFLTNKPQSDEEIFKEVDYLAGRKSNYYLGDTVLEDHEPKTNEEFLLEDQGGFIVTVVGPGYNNINNHSKFEGNWEKAAIKDSLTIKSDFTWERRKEIDKDFFLIWNGNYQYSSVL